MHKTLLEEALVQILQNMRQMSMSLEQINKHMYVVQSRGIEIRLPIPEELKEPVGKLASNKYLEVKDDSNMWVSRRIKAKLKP